MPRPAAEGRCVHSVQLYSTSSVLFNSNQEWQAFQAGGPFKTRANYPLMTAMGWSFAIFLPIPTL